MIGVHRQLMNHSYCVWLKKEVRPYQCLGCWLEHYKKLRKKGIEDREECKKTYKCKRPK